MNDKYSNEAMARDLLAKRKIPTGDAIAGPSETIPDEQDDFTYLCRICTIRTPNILPLFEKEGLEQKLVEKINKYLPIKVSKDDLLPAGVCEQCSNAVLAWHELVVCCVQADASFRKRISLSHTQTVTSQAAETSTSVDEPHIDEDGIKCKKAVMFLTLVNNVLTDYLKKYNMEDSEWAYVCQKCPQKPVCLNSSELTEHLELTHCDELHNRQNLEEFINLNITFNVVLLSESEVDEFDAETHKAKMPKDVVCLYCKSSFSSTKRLIFHLSKHIDIGKNGGIICCDENYDNFKLFEQHLRSEHSKIIPAHVCKSCGYSANDQRHLRKHIDTDHKEAHKNYKAKPEKLVETNQRSIPAVCPECNKTYSNKYNMFTHMETHKKRKKFSCNKCEKIYLNKGTLSRHTELVHEGRLPFACAACGEGFPTRRARGVHQRLHTGEAPYHCRHCGKAFRAENTLRHHLDAHLDIRKYECSVCFKRFRKNTHLKSHLNTHKKIRTN